MELRTRRGASVKERCSSCGSDRFDEIVAAFDRQVARRDDYSYGRCAACSLVSLRPTPADDEIAGLYPDDYAPHAPETTTRRPVWRAPSALERFAARHCLAGATGGAAGPDVRARLLQTVSRLALRGLMDPRGRNRLLDVGCGAGRILARHRAFGWEVRGIDPSPRAVAACHARGLAVQQAGLMEADLPSRHFDVILLHHVIEHVPRPLEALRRARELLAPGGVIVLVTPNVGGLGFRMYGSCWYALDAPRHLHLFDVSSLIRLCESAGTRVESIWTEASPRILVASRHRARTQGAILPPGLAARTAALARSRAQGEGSRALRRAIHPAAQLLAWLGYGETLRATLVEPAAAPRDRAHRA